MSPEDPHEPDDETAPITIPPMSEIVEAEIRQMAGSDRIETLIHYLNNFSWKIPGSLGKSMSDVERELIESEFKKRGLNHNYNKKLLDIRPIKDLRKAGYSDKRIFGTNEQYRQDIRTAITESGVDVLALHAYIDYHIQNKISPVGRSGQHHLIEPLILPIFIRLREMGYSRMDLWV